MLTVAVAVVTVSASFDSGTYPSNTTLYAPSYTLYLEYAEGEAGEVFETIQLPTMVGMYFGSTVEIDVQLSSGRLVYYVSWNADYDLKRMRLCTTQTFAEGVLLAYLYDPDAPSIPVRLSSSERYYAPEYFDVGEAPINASNGAIDTFTGFSTSLIRNTRQDLSYFTFRQAVATFRSVPFPITDNTQLTVTIPLVQTEDVQLALGTVFTRGADTSGGRVDASDLFDSIISGVGRVFTAPLFGRVTLGDLLYVALAVAVISMALKFFAGG